MKKYWLVWLLVGSCLCPFAQNSNPAKKTRHIAAVDAASVNARSVSVRYIDGLKNYYAGRTTDASKIFNGIILDMPKHDASYFMLAKIYTDLKDYHLAQQSLLTAIKIDKQNVWYKVELANLYMTMQQYEQAAKLWEQIIKEKDNNEYYAYSLAECYFNTEKYVKVIDAYNMMEKIMGHNDELTKVKVQVWLYMGKLKEAVGEYDKLIKEFPHNAEFYVEAGNIYRDRDMMDQAYNYYEKALELNPNDLHINMTMATYWGKKGETAKQQQCLLSVFECAEYDATEKARYLKPFMDKALKTKSVGDIQSAELLADKLVAVNPENYMGYYAKATLCALKESYQEAVDYYEKAISIDNTSFELWDRYCFSLNKTQNVQRLVQYENDILELFPQNAVMLGNLGLAYLYANQPDKAIEYLKQALALAYEPSQQVIIYQGLGSAFKVKGDMQSAEYYWNKARQKQR